MANRTAAVDISSALGGLEALKALAEPIARAMGVAMGQEVRDEAKIRAPELKPGNEGADKQRAGQLRDAIYLAFDGRRSILGQQYVYAVSWNHAKAPHGHLLEFGHWMPYEAVRGKNGQWYTPLVGKVKRGGRNRNQGVPLVQPKRIAPIPFLGPAYDSKFPRLNAIAAAAGAAKYTELTK